MFSSHTNLNVISTDTFQEKKIHQKSHILETDKSHILKTDIVLIYSNTDDGKSSKLTRAH